MTKVKLGIIGLGCRGEGLLSCTLKMLPNVDVVAVCDEYPDRAEAGRDLVAKERGNTPLCTTHYKDVVACKEVNAVLISTAWEAHIPIAIEAMKAGKYTAMEVGGAYSIDDCYKLVHTYEETKTPCMLLENCCFGRRELMLLDMVREGVLGEICHCTGSYAHDLREEIAYGDKNRHYRLRNYTKRNCENYPTHELGPIAKLLNINHGNLMLSLTSVASKSRGLHEYIKNNMPENEKLMNTNFAQGDVITTTITCAGGETILLTLDTTLPRFYSRGLTVKGTKGSYCEDNDSLFIDGIHNGDEFEWSKQWGNAQKYFDEHTPRLWKKYAEAAQDAGHDGMDFMSLSSFFECVEKNALPPIDVYDAAAWMSISALSAQSVAMGGTPVAIPDFTSGKWIKFKKEQSPLEFSLD